MNPFMKTINILEKVYMDGLILHEIVTLYLPIVDYRYA